MYRPPPVPLTKKRQDWARARGGAVFYGKPLTYPAATEARYRATLEKAIAPMLAETEAAVAALWGSNANRYAMDAPGPSMTQQARHLTDKLQAKFFAFFDRIAQPTAEGLYTGVNRHSVTNLHASLSGATGGLSLKTSVITGKIAEVTRAGIVENVGLIKSIPRQYFPRIQQTVMRSITTGQGTKTVLEAIRAIGHSTEKRAKLIARDQTSKATTSLNAARMQALGVRKFQWLHSYGGKVPRPLHKHGLNGNVYELAAPPVIDPKTGERGLPGQLINCRCRMGPVVDFSDPSVAPTPPPAPLPPSAKVPAALKPRKAPRPRGRPPVITAREAEFGATLRELGIKNGVEFLSVQDEAGAMVVSPYRGQKASVPFNAEAKALIMDPKRSVIAHHNHPSSQSLSQADFECVQFYPGLKKLWAHGHNGAVYAAEKGKFPFDKAYMDLLERRWDKSARAAHQAGEVKWADLVQVWWHVINLGQAKRGRIGYTFKLAPEQEKAMKAIKPLVDGFLKGIAEGTL